MDCEKSKVFAPHLSLRDSFLADECIGVVFMSLFADEKCPKVTKGSSP